ncbi:chemotaxis protein [Modestobacter sp. VKM Ac-2676]|nr:chemotaxis protein [Modestobacter sp. VKM Ac-2676]
MPAPTTPSSQRSWWGDRSVRTKVLATAGIASAVAAGIGVMGLTALGGSADAADALYADNLLGIAAAAEMDARIGDMRVNLRDTILGADPQAAIAQIDELGATFRATSEDYRAATENPGKLELLDGIVTDVGEYLEFQQTVLVPLAQAADYQAWMAQNASGGTPPVTSAIEGIQELTALEATEAEQAVADNRASYEQQRTLSLVLIVLGVAVALGLGWLVARSISHAAGRVQAVAEGLAAGDLTRTSGLTTQDELGRMGAALDGAVVELRAVMTSVVASADAVAASSEELSASSAQISASAEETSAQSNVVSSAAEEVSRNVGTVAAGAEEMGASIREISQNANEAARVAASAVAEAEATTLTVTKLGDSSREIGEVVKAITSIAEQTNLLALNATIEAARAGDAGKGFAVVANEVKELAQETARATEDIARRVEAIQGDTSGAVAAIGRISEVIGSINDFQLTIASAVEEQTATTNEMSRSVQEAAGGSTEIAANITGVSSAAASTTQALTQTRQAVDELSRMASDLRGSVARFTF